MLICWICEDLSLWHRNRPQFLSCEAHFVKLLFSFDSYLQFFFGSLNQHFLWFARSPHDLIFAFPGSKTPSVCPNYQLLPFAILLSLFLEDDKIQQPISSKRQALLWLAKSSKGQTHSKSPCLNTYIKIYFSKQKIPPWNRCTFRCCFDYFLFIESSFRKCFHILYWYCQWNFLNWSWPSGTCSFDDWVIYQWQK